MLKMPQPTRTTIAQLSESAAPSQADGQALAARQFLAHGASVVLKGISLAELQDLSLRTILTQGVSARPSPFSIQRKVSPPATTRSVAAIAPQFDGEIVLYAGSKEQSSDALKDRLRGRPTDQVSYAKDRNELAYYLSRRRAGLLIELSSGAPTVAQEYLTPDHFPRHVLVSNPDGVVAALNNESSWLTFSRRYAHLLRSSQEDVLYECQLRRVAQSSSLATLSVISGRVTSDTDRTTRRLIAAVAQATQAREVGSGAQAESATGFLKGYRVGQFREMLALPGARLAVASAGGILLGYYLFFLDEGSFPSRGREIAEALRSTSVVHREDSLAYAKIMEVTPAGRDFARILNIDLYDMLQRTGLAEMRECGQIRLIGECRGYPYPNREALRAHTVHGWEFSKTALVRPTSDGDFSVAALFTRSSDDGAAVHPAVANAPMRKKPMHPLPFPRRGLRSGASSPFNTRLPRTFSFSPEERRSMMDQLLGNETLRVLEIGESGRAWECVELRRHEDGSASIGRRVWDDTLGKMTFHEHSRVSKDGTTASSSFTDLDDLLALVNRFWSPNPGR